MFCFDNVFDESNTQETIYELIVKPLVHNFKNGYNCTVFTYGQTGTGKTYTMGSNPEVRPIIKMLSWQSQFECTTFSDSSCVMMLMQDLYPEPYKSFSITMMKVIQSILVYHSLKFIMKESMTC